MKLFLSSSLLALLGFLITFTSPLAAQTTAAPKEKKIPFHGKLMAVDGTANTITIEGKTPRVFHLTPTTKITDGSGAPSTLLAAVVGEDVGGSYSKDAAGTMNLFSVRFGAKTGTAAKPTAAAPAPVTAPTPVAPSVAAPPAPSAAPAAPAATTAATAKVKKQTFTGKVVSVDAAANTLVVHGKADQTFTVTPTTKITDATGAASTLAAVTAGAKVSGSYSKSADGATLTVYTLKISK